MDRVEWRHAVRQSRLPKSVKLTLVTHAELGRGRFHDDRANLHAFSRKRLAKLTGCDERTIQRHLKTAEESGWLQRHAGGHHGKQTEFQGVSLPPDSDLKWEISLGDISGEEGHYGKVSEIHR
jgi:helix-turn-helix protein